MVPTSAKTKGKPGPKKKVLPSWCERVTRRYPPEAMARAIALLQPAATPQKQRMKGGQKTYAQSDCERIAAQVSAEFSNPTEGIECYIYWRTLREHKEAADRGEEIVPPGRTTGIPQTVVENKEQSATYKAEQELRRLLVERVLQLDRKLHDTLLRAVVAPAVPREGEIVISGEEYAEFQAWREKKRAKKERDQMSTQGQLLSEAQFLDKMAVDKKRKREEEEKTQANKQAREERAEAKIVDAHEKQKAHAERLASEAVVRDLLKSCDCWNSKKGYVMVGDMDKFIKTYRDDMKKLSKYGAKMSADDKLALLEQAVDECSFARRSGRRR